MQPVFYNTKLTQQLLKKSDFLGWNKVYAIEVEAIMSIKNLMPTEQFLQMSWFLAPFLLQLTKSNTVET